MKQEPLRNVWRSVRRYMAFVLAIVSTLLIPFEIIPPLLGRPYAMPPWAAVVLIGAGFLLAFLMLAFNQVQGPAVGAPVGARELGHKLAGEWLSGTAWSWLKAVGSSGSLLLWRTLLALMFLADLLGLYSMYEKWRTNRDVALAWPEAPIVAIVTVVAVAAYLLARARVATEKQEGVSSRISTPSPQPQLELRVKEARDANLVPDWLEALCRDEGQLVQYKKYQLALKEKATLILRLNLGVTHHFQRLTHVTFTVEPDTDWRLLQPPYQPQPLVELSYPDDSGRPVKARDELLLLGEGHKDVLVTVTLRPKLCARGGGYKPLGGLSRLAVTVHVAAPREAYDLHVDFDAQEIHGQMEDVLEQVINKILKTRAGRDSLIQKGEMRRFFAILRELGPD